jgi:hypothetical protein
VTPSLNLVGNNGVIDNCIFDKPYKQIYWNETGYYPAWGYGILVNGAGWINSGWRTLDQLLGQYNAEMPVIETCSFQRCRHCISATGGGYVIDSYRGSDAYYVARHNTFTDNVRCYYNSFIDLHPGARGFEAYDNVFIDVLSDYRSISSTDWYKYMNRVTTCDSGSGLIFNNTVYYCNEGVNLRDTTAVQNNETWRVKDWWIWDNTYNNVANELNIVNGTVEPFTIVENDEYFLSEPTIEQLGFDYHPLVYPLFADQEFEETTNIYTLETSIITPEPSSIINSSMLNFEFTTTGNDTLIDKQVALLASNGTKIGNNQTELTGTFTDLTNDTYTLAITVTGLNGGYDYLETEFTIEITLFEEATLTINVYGEGTTSLTNGTYLYNVSDAIVLTATPFNSSWVFLGWLENGTWFTDSPNYNFTVTEDTTLTAVFYDPTAKETPIIIVTPSPITTPTTIPNVYAVTVTVVTISAAVGSVIVLFYRRETKTRTESV